MKEDQDLDISEPLTKAQQDQLMRGVVRDVQRMQALGLIPADGARISARGEFIVEPSSVEEDENRKMRSYRPKEFPKMLHGWPEGAEEPTAIVVRNAKEQERALAAGWSVDPLIGPSGRLGVIEAPAAPVVEEVREFAPPGQRQPFEEPDPVVEDDAPKARGRRRG